MSLYSVTLCHGTAVQCTVGRSPPPHSPAAHSLKAKCPESKWFNTQCVFTKTTRRLQASVQCTICPVLLSCSAAEAVLASHHEDVIRLQQCHQVQMQSLHTVKSLCSWWKTFCCLWCIGSELMKQGIFEEPKWLYLETFLTFHCNYTLPSTPQDHPFFHYYVHINTDIAHTAPFFLHLLYMYV